jgi:hypothetical protein
MISTRCLLPDRTPWARVSASAWGADWSRDVLADAEDVAVGVFEPGDFAAVGGGPDAEGLVLGEGVLFGGNAAVAEPSGDGLDVFDLPSEDGALQRVKIGHLEMRIMWPPMVMTRANWSRLTKVNPSLPS